MSDAELVAQRISGNNLSVGFPTGGVTVQRQDTLIWEERFLQFGKSVNASLREQLDPFTQCPATCCYSTQAQIQNFHALAFALLRPDLHCKFVKGFDLGFHFYQKLCSGG